MPVGVEDAGISKSVPPIDRENGRTQVNRSSDGCGEIYLILVEFRNMKSVYQGSKRSELRVPIKLDRLATEGQRLV